MKYKIALSIFSLNPEGWGGGGGDLQTKFGKNFNATFPNKILHQTRERM